MEGQAGLQLLEQDLWEKKLYLTLIQHSKINTITCNMLPRAHKYTICMLLF